MNKKYDYPRNLLPFIVTLCFTLFGMLVFNPTHWFIPLIPIIFGVFLSGHMFYTDYKISQTCGDVAE